MYGHLLRRSAYTCRLLFFTYQFAHPYLLCTLSTPDLVPLIILMLSLRPRWGTPPYELIIHIYVDLPAIELIPYFIPGYSERIVQVRKGWL